MLRALRLAERGRGRTSPNPVVGAVVVQGGRVVGEGWHDRWGARMRSGEALERAGARARGATLYVTLEPCAHTGRTPPCTDALIDAGIRRCVVALRDPHRIVNGRGMRALRACGHRGEPWALRRARARKSSAATGSRIPRGRPQVIWKVAATLDGRIADRRRRSRWITGAESRAAVHRMRARSDAVRDRLRHRAGGRSAAHGADAARGARSRCGWCATRALKLPLGLRLFGARLAAGTVVACGRGAPVARQRALERRGVRVWRLPVARSGVSPRGTGPPPGRGRAATRCCSRAAPRWAPRGSAPAWWTASRCSWRRECSAPRVFPGAVPLGIDRLAARPQRTTRRTGPARPRRVSGGGLRRLGNVHGTGRGDRPDRADRGRRRRAAIVGRGHPCGGWPRAGRQPGGGRVLSHDRRDPRAPRCGWRRYRRRWRRTTLGARRAGDEVNLERALRLDQRLGGHLVQGHVDGVGEVTSVAAEGEGSRVTFSAPAELCPLRGGEGLDRGRRREPHGGGVRGREVRGRLRSPHARAPRWPEATGPVAA